MLGTEHPLADRQRALVEWARRRRLALGPKQASEVVEVHCRIGMLRSSYLLVDSQCALKERASACIGGSAVKIAACVIQEASVSRTRRVVGGFHLADCEEMWCQQRAARP